MTDIRITAAIVAHNAESTVAAAIESLKNQELDPIEIILVDDGSTDSTAKIAADAGARVLSHPECRGVAAARNTAWKNAAGDVIAFIDADAEAHADLLKMLAREYFLDSVVGVGGQGIEVETDGLANRWRAAFWRQTHGDQRQGHVWMLPGLCCSYRISALEKLGGFDERFRTNGEDVDIGLRIFSTHDRMVYRPDAKVDHHRRDTLGGLFQMAFRHSRWQAIAVKKNRWRGGFLLWQAIKWIIITSGSSIKRHKSPALLLLSPFVTTWAVLGRLTGMLKPRLRSEEPSS